VNGGKATVAEQAAHASGAVELRVQLLGSPRMPAWLRDESGVRVPVRAEGLLIGRDPACSIVVDAPEVSRRHALVVHEPSGLRFIVFTPRAATLNGRDAPAESQLATGDVIGVGAMRFEVLTSDEEEPMTAWTLDVGGRGYRVRSTPFVVGGGEGDDLIVPGLAPAALTLHATGRDLVLATDHPATVAGVSVDRLCSVRDRDRIALGPVSMKVRRTTGDDATTLGERHPTRAVLRLLPNGGLLELRSGTEKGVWLPDRRCDLVAALLAPQAPASGGDLIPDATLIARVWPGETATRAELATLVHRVRHTLTLAGFDGPSIVERSQQGSTRFRLAPGATVEVVS
jgi:hypothetical protein